MSNSSTGQNMGCHLTNLSFSSRVKMAFGKYLNFGALKHQRSTHLLVEVTNYTGTHSSMVHEHVPTVGVLLPPWQSQQLKC